MKLLRSKKIITIVVIFVILFTTILRLHKLEADPDKEIDGDPGIFTDEGLYSLTARNLNLFKTFNPHKPNLIVEGLDSPLYFFSQYLSFRAFGVNIKALRIPSIVFSLIILVITYYFMIKIFGYNSALLTVIFLGFNYILIQYNRLALIETLLSLLIVTSYYILFSEELPSKRRIFYSGVIYGLSIITKGTALFFLPGFLLAIAIGNIDVNWVRKNILNVTLFTTGIATVVISNEIYILLIKFFTDLGTSTVIKPNTIIGMAKSFLIRRSIGDWLKNLTQILGSRFSMRMPVLFFICYFSSFWLIATYKRPISYYTRNKLLLSLWFLSGIFFMSFFSYGPNRYRIPLVLPVCMISAVIINEWVTSVEERIKLVRNKRIACIAIIAFGLIGFRILRVASVMGRFELSNNIIGIFAFLTSTILVILLYRFLPLEIRITRKIKKAIIPCFLIMFLAYQLIQYYRWSNFPTYNIKNGNMEIEKVINGGVVGGTYAPIFCLETKEIAVPLWEPNRSNIKKLSLTHYLDCVDGNFNSEFMIITERYPDFLQNIKLVHKFYLGNLTVSLYSINQEWNE